MFRFTTVAASSFIATRRSLSRRALSFVTTNPPARSTTAALAIGAGGKQQSLLCPLSSAAPTAALFAAATTARHPPRFYSTTTATMASVNDVIQSFTTPCVGTDVSLAMQSLADADCVCFDVDSTVINEEGIDVLADYLGKGQEVAALTLAAMEGGMKFQDALAARLTLLQPSKESIQACLRHHPLELTPGVQELVQELQEQNKHVYLVSGGFRIMIEPVAEMLNIPVQNIVANHILFHDDTGAYRDFDAHEPTSQDMGKPKALEMIQAQGGYKTMVMVGDGATDAQAKPPAKAFIGFGGVAVREKVKAVADWFVTDFGDLTKVLRSLA